MYNAKLVARILQKLDEAFPDRLHLHEVRAAIPEYQSLPDKEWLSAVQALRLEGKLDGKFLPEGTGIADAAALFITKRGRLEFSELDRGKAEAPSHADLENTCSVFISYSWDSDEHKKWARGLAAQLRADGIHAIIDQTHLQLGASTTEFMERSVRESSFVLVVCTPEYKRRFDHRKGGAGYESNIITGEIVNEIGKNKFIPVLRSGDWQKAMPTALSGVQGVDLRNDSTEEYRKLVGHLHRVVDIPPVGSRPQWLDNPSETSGLAAVTKPQDLSAFWDQRKLLPDTDIIQKIWSKPRWRIWICPTEFKRARFQSLEHCRQFILSSQVRFSGPSPYPWVAADSIETGHEWVAGEIDISDTHLHHTERWVLFRSGQFVHNQALRLVAESTGRVHVLEILETVTAVFELAERMAQRGVLTPQALITFELQGVEGISLTWPEDMFGRSNAVEPECWSQDEAIKVGKLVGSDELEKTRRSLALELALEIYSKFGWLDPPQSRLVDEQLRRFGAGR